MTCIFATTHKNRLKSLKKEKKAASLWLSWVLLFAFVIAISALSYRFIVPMVQDTTEDVKKVVFNTDECRQAAISLEEVCQDSTAQHLNMTIRNRNYIRIDELRFQWFDANNVPVSSSELEVKHAPNRAKKYSVDTGTSSVLGFVKVTPVLQKEGMTIICGEKAASTTTIPDC
ncbi:hypothetical protein ACFL96_06610 [Thermoproteota archaeon]